MICWLPDIPASVTLPLFFPAYDSNGASVTITGLATTDIEIYKGTSMTQRASDNGYALIDTDGIDLDTRTGIHGFSLDLSDNSDAGFYAAGSFYHVVIDAITVDTQTVRFIFAFRIVAAESIAGTPKADVAAWLGTAAATPTVAGVPEVDVTHLLGTAWLTPGTAGTPDVNAKLLGGTAQTGRDIGASVLLSNGTGTGQLKLASGYVAMTWADIAAPTTVVNLSGTTIKTATDVETDTQDLQARIPAALTAGGFMKSVLENAAHGGAAATLRLGSSTSTPAFHVTNSGGDAVEFTSSDVLSSGLLISSQSSALEITSSSSGNGVIITGAGSGSGVRMTGGGTGHGLFVSGGLSGGHGVHIHAGTASSDAALAIESHAAGAGIEITAGSTGNGITITTTDGDAVNLNAAGSGKVSLNAPDGIAANITGNLSGSAGSVTGAVGSVTGNVGGNVVGSVASVTNPVTAGTVSDKTGYALTSGERDAIAAALLDLTDAIESGITPRKAIRAIAARAGLLSGAGTGTEVLKGLGQGSGGTTRITYTVDASGNITAATLNL